MQQHLLSLFNKNHTTRKERLQATEQKQQDLLKTEISDSGLN